MRKISNAAFFFSHREVNENLVCSFFPFSFLYLLPVTEPADRCHQCCIQHKFLQAFRHKLTQLTSGFAFSCHPDLLHFPVPNWLTLWGSPSCTRVLLPGTGLSVCVSPQPTNQPTNTFHVFPPILKKMEEDMLSCSLCRTHTFGSGFIILCLPSSKSSMSRVLFPPSPSQFPISKQELPYKGKSG